LEGSSSSLFRITEKLSGECWNKSAEEAYSCVGRLKEEDRGNLSFIPWRKERNQQLFFKNEKSRPSETIWSQYNTNMNNVYQSHPPAQLTLLAQRRAFLEISYCHWRGTTLSPLPPAVATISQNCLALHM
jgi:hypothetical protein